MSSFYLLSAALAAKSNFPTTTTPRHRETWDSHKTTVT